MDFSIEEIMSDSIEKSLDGTETYFDGENSFKGLSKRVK